MPLQFDMHTAEITYEGHKVGEYRVENGVAKVTLDLTYECGIEEWIVPLSWFDYGLNLFAEAPSQTTGSRRRGRNRGRRHSRTLHGAASPYRKKPSSKPGTSGGFTKATLTRGRPSYMLMSTTGDLKLDAITGDIFDATTRVRCMRLKKGKLRDIQTQLRDSPDFSATVAHHIDDPD